MTDLERAEYARDLVYLQTDRDKAVNAAKRALAMAVAEHPNADHSALEQAVHSAHTVNAQQIARLEHLLAPPTELMASLPPALHTGTPARPPAAATPPRAPTPAWPFSAVMLVGALVMAWSGRTFLQSVQTLQWSEVPAVISVSDMQTTRVGTKTVASAAFEYTYNVDGTSYTSSQVSLAGTRTSGPSRWDVGDDVTAYVNTQDASQAVLLTGPDTWTSVQFGVGLLLMAAGGIGRRRAAS